MCWGPWRSSSESPVSGGRPILPKAKKTSSQRDIFFLSTGYRLFAEGIKKSALWFNVSTLLTYCSCSPVLIKASSPGTSTQASTTWIPFPKDWPNSLLPIFPTHCVPFLPPLLLSLLPLPSWRHSECSAETTTPGSLGNTIVPFILF